MRQTVFWCCQHAHHSGEVWEFLWGLVQRRKLFSCGFADASPLQVSLLEAQPQTTALCPAVTAVKSSQTCFASISPIDGLQTAGRRGGRLRRLVKAPSAHCHFFFFMDPWPSLDQESSFFFSPTFSQPAASVSCIAHVRRTQLVMLNDT